MVMFMQSGKRPLKKAKLKSIWPPKKPKLSKEELDYLEKRHWRVLPRQMERLDEHVTRLADIEKRLGKVGTKMRFEARKMQWLKHMGDYQEYCGHQTLHHQLEKERDALYEQQWDVVTNIDAIIKNVKKQQGIWGKTGHVTKRN